MFLLDGAPWLLLFVFASAANILYEPGGLELYDGDACVLRNGSAGTCRPANQCDWVMSNPASTKQLVTCAFNMSVPIVCCMNGISNMRTINPAQRISEAQCEQFPKPSNLSDHIFNGVAAQFGEYPHMAALVYRAQNVTRFRCGASLISPRFLLTAAHCVSEWPDFARLGVLELEPAHVVDEPLDIAIRNVTLHPNYTLPSYANDIALLELDEEVTAAWSFVQPACLYMNGSGGQLRPDVPLSVQGWGVRLPGDTVQEQRLQKANVSLIGRDACQRDLPPTRRHRNGLHPGQLCALGRNARNETIADTCPGDSGGPLELVVDGRHYLVGVTSLGYMCGSPIPGIYTDISFYLDWIESIVWPEQ
uniref:Uncharacterized protein n=1 Tax=Anopheles atroparvus TaxID=41427 RepID=A0A182IUX5_ANOAO